MKKSCQKLENGDGDSLPSAEEVLPARITYLTPALIEEARVEINETEETREQGLTELRKKIEAEPKLYTPTDDLFLLSFLRARKFNVKKAFKLLRSYWSFRKEYKKIYDYSEAKPVKNAIERGYFGLLPYRDRNGSLVFLGKISQWNPEVDTYENLFRAISGILVYSLEHEATQIAGYRAIIDIRGVTWQQMKYMTPENVLLLIRSTQFCFPGRYKGVHVLSDNKMIKFLWRLASPFLSSKLRKRIFFHGEDPTPISQYIHPSVLPEEFGGRAPPFDNINWMEVIESREDTITGLLKYGYKD